jgi:hypothetical protein
MQGYFKLIRCLFVAALLMNDWLRFAIPSMGWEIIENKSAKQSWHASLPINGLSFLFAFGNTFFTCRGRKEAPFAPEEKRGYSTAKHVWRWNSWEFVASGEVFSSSQTYSLHKERLDHYLNTFIFLYRESN